jgi:HEAT repeat protein
MENGQIDAALTAVHDYLLEHPDALEARRLQMIVLLRAERIEEAYTALQQLPAGDPALSDALRHRDPFVRAGAAQLAAEHPKAASFQRLLEGLDDSVPTVRRCCARALGLLRNRAALRPLFSLLRDDNWFVRAEVATALGRIGDPRAASWLIHLINDSDGFVRYSASRAMRELVSEENRAQLLRALTRLSIKHQVGIAAALGKLRDPTALDVLLNATGNKDPQIRQRVAEALTDFVEEPAAVDALNRLLLDSDEAVRKEAGRALATIDRSAEPATRHGF